MVCIWVSAGETGKGKRYNEVYDTRRRGGIRAFKRAFLENQLFYSSSISVILSIRLHRDNHQSDTAVFALAALQHRTVSDSELLSLLITICRIDKVLEDDRT